MTTHDHPATGGVASSVEPLPNWIVARSPAFVTVIEQVRKLAEFDVTVLIEGETGVGKELVVRLLHYMSARAGRAFVPVNAGAIPDNLFEDELFGHAAGAYTGARGASEGLVALAEGGTLFLDEIDALSSHAQAALLRFLQDRSYRTVGGRNLCTANVRIVTATNACPRDLVERGLLRQDLYFRLSGVRIAIPPLRQRAEDVLALADHFLADLNATRTDRAPRYLGEAMRAWLVGELWVGNVRELRSAIERSFIFSPGAELEPPLPAGAELRVQPSPTQQLTFRDAKNNAVHDFEVRFLDMAMRENHGNITRAAQASGKERKAFDRLLRKHGLDAARYRPAGSNPPVA